MVLTSLWNSPLGLSCLPIELPDDEALGSQEQRRLHLCLTGILTEGTSKTELHGYISCCLEVFWKAQCTTPVLREQGVTGHTCSAGTEGRGEETGRPWDLLAYLASSRPVGNPVSKDKVGAGESAQWLRALLLSQRTRDESLVPISGGSKATCNMFQETQGPLSALWAPLGFSRSAHRYT